MTRYHFELLRTPPPPPQENTHIKKTYPSCVNNNMMDALKIYAKLRWGGKVSLAPIESDTLIQKQVYVYWRWIMNFLEASRVWNRDRHGRDRHEPFRILCF